MDNYINKIKSLKKLGYSAEKIAENIYLNYQSIYNIDEVYEIRKSLSLLYRCNINDIKLIGSAHTGYTIENDDYKIRDDPNDYDFAIINSNVFIEYYHRVNKYILSKQNLKMLNYNILNGKLHFKYVDKYLKNEVKGNISKIEEELKLKKHVTVCIYLSEKSFINGIVRYNNELYVKELKESRDCEKFHDVKSFELNEINKIKED